MNFTDYLYKNKEFTLEIIPVIICKNIITNYSNY